MYLSKRSDRSAGRRMGFTLVEMLIVIAIIAILLAIAIPVFSVQLEKARNETDVYNAKTIARAIQIYFLSNPDKLEEFVAKYGANPRADRPYILVTKDLIMVSTEPLGILEEALSEAGLLGKELYNKRYDGVKCKTRKSWQSYTIGFTVTDGELKMGYCGRTISEAKYLKWTTWTNPDPTPFRSMCVPTT